MTRRSLRTAATILVVAALASTAPHAQVKSGAPDRHLRVYKSLSCGCCASWVKYMESNGFTVAVTNMEDVSPIKVQNGVPSRLTSCHTTLVGGYVIEGHVPVADIRRLLKERPKIAGLAAPGMPQGSPGMDVPNSPPFEILAFDKSGRTTVFSTYTPK